MESVSAVKAKLSLRYWRITFRRKRPLNFAWSHKETLNKCNKLTLYIENKGHLLVFRWIFYYWPKSFLLILITVKSDLFGAFPSVYWTYSGLGKRTPSLCRLHYSVDDPESCETCNKLIPEKNCNVRITLGMLRMSFTSSFSDKILGL